jgi:D-alanyl-D-alanine carboxypeptidase
MKYLIIILTIAIAFSACSESLVLDEEYYECQLPFNDSSEQHPNAFDYQQILDKAQKQGIIGASVMIKDASGVWLGTAGMADVSNNIKLQSCTPMFIASISKVFTAALIYTFVEDGTLSLDNYVTDWLGESALKNLSNAGEAQIKHLLNHTSGIPDFYTMKFDMVRLNKEFNNFSLLEILDYARGLEAYNPVGDGYRYSNTNYILLGMIIETASGKKLSDLFTERIFIPNQLQYAYYGGDNPIPQGAAKGYVDMYGDGKLVEATFLYNDEIVSPDGGIAITAYETGLFFEKLIKGEVINDTSLATMLTSFELPDGWWDPTYHTMQGANGIQKFLTPNGIAYGHTGGIWGFSSVVQYFPDSDRTFVMIMNSASYDEEAKKTIYNECMEIMFSDQ